MCPVNVAVIVGELVSAWQVGVTVNGNNQCPRTGAEFDQGIFQLTDLDFRRL
jgi:hypothetical protein